MSTMQPQTPAAPDLRTLKHDLVAQGLTGLQACRIITEAAEELTRTTAVDEATAGASWQHIADQLGMASRQAAQQKYGPVGKPGLSAREAAHAAAVHPDTIARSPGKYGYDVREHDGRRRYFRIESR